MNLESLEAPVRAKNFAAYYREQNTPVRERAWVTVLQLCVSFAATTAVAGYISWRVLAWPTLTPVSVGGVLVVGAVWVLFLLRRARARIEGNVRLSRFATLNGLTFHAKADLDGLPGSPLRAGASRVTSGVLDARRAVRPFVAGSHNCVMETTAGPSAVSFRFIALPWGARVPHIGLSNHSAGILSATESNAIQRPRLSLGGAFDRTFSLHSSAGYEHDALYLMTPEVLELLMQISGACELEFVDNYAIIYLAPGEPWRRDTIETTLAAIEVIAHKLAQMGRYRDDRTELAAPPRAKPSTAVSAPRWPDRVDLQTHHLARTP